MTHWEKRLQERAKVTGLTITPEDVLRKVEMVRGSTSSGKVYVVLAKGRKYRGKLGKGDTLVAVVTSKGIATILLTRDAQIARGWKDGVVVK